MFATALISVFCWENTDTYTFTQRPSATSVFDLTSVFDFVTKPEAPTGIDDKHCAIDQAIICGCLRRMGAALRWRPTELMLGDALTKDKADGAELLRACVRTPECQVSEESSTLIRAREERKIGKKTNNIRHSEIRGNGRPSARKIVPSLTDVFQEEVSVLPAKTALLKPAPQQRQRLGDSATDNYHKQHSIDDVSSVQVDAPRPGRTCEISTRHPSNTSGEPRRTVRAQT